jgi:hypothetical protein
MYKYIIMVISVQGFGWQLSKDYNKFKPFGSQMICLCVFLSQVTIAKVIMNGCNGQVLF